MLRSTLSVALCAIGAEAVLRQYNFTVHSDTRSPGMSTVLHLRMVTVELFRKHELRTKSNHFTDGFQREVYLINGQQPGPLIDVDEGDDVEVFVRNELSIETTLHWHGTPLLVTLYE